MRHSQRRPIGFSLVELIVVVAIVGILSAMSVAAYDQIGTSSAPQNAVNDMVAAMVRARGRAAERQTEVWFIIYPEYRKDPASLAGGDGAYFVFEDKTLNFNSTAVGALDVGYRSGDLFDPFGKMFGANGQLLDSAIFEEYAGKSVKMALPGLSPVILGPEDAPFTNLNVPPNGCSFCSAGPGGRRGAVVFSPDGSARFVNGAGAPAIRSGVNSEERGHSVAMSSKKKNRIFIVAMSGPTSYIAAFSKTK